MPDAPGKKGPARSGPDMRVHPRVDFFNRVHVTVPGEETAIDVFASNVSKGGMFLRSNRPLPKGKKLALEFETGKGKIQVEEGEVMWSQPFDPVNVTGSLPGMGVRFNRLAPGSSQCIASFIEEALGEAGATGGRTAEAPGAKPIKLGPPKDSSTEPLPDVAPPDRA